MLLFIVIFNDLFVLNSLNVANLYIFKCERAQKMKMGGEYLANFGPLLYIFQLFLVLKVAVITFFSFLKS